VRFIHRLSRTAAHAPSRGLTPASGSRAAGWLAVVALLAGVLSGCDAHDGPSHYRVAQRDFTWHGTAPDRKQPNLSLVWRFGDGVSAPGTWAPAAPTVLTRKGDRADAVCALGGRGTLDLVGPGAGIVDPDVQHWLTFRARTTTAASVSVHWRNTGEDFSPSRRTSELPLDASGKYADYQIALSSLRGIREAADAQDGVEEFRLRFRGAGDDDEVAVEVEQLALVSDYDTLDDQGVHLGHLERRGVTRQGIALRLPGTATLDVPADEGDRLRFALAVGGADGPVDVILRERDGRLPEQHFSVQPGDGWAEHALALPEGALQFEVTTAGEPGFRAVLLVGSVLRLERTTEPRAPVVLYVEDTLRADRVTSAGYGHPTTPHLSEIAAQGASFTRAWAPSNWTRPSVSSILTSLDPVAHGNGVHTRRIPASLVTLPEALAAQGYLTASFITNYHAGAWSGLDQGFDVHAEPRAFGASDVVSTLTSNLIRDPIAEFLTEHADEQVFVFAHSLDPHTPYAPLSDDVLTLLRDRSPRPTIARGDRARFDESTLNYDAEVLHNDHALAALDATLLATGLLPRTLFVFASDHGEAFGEHGQWEHRQSLHEEELRVPWIMRLPGTVAAGVRIDTPASLVDLAPTLFGLLGLPAPPDWSGVDLSGLCRAGAAGAPQSAEGTPAAVRRPRPLIAEAIYDEPPRPGVRHEIAVIAGSFKVIATVDEHGACTARALYDLSADPGELTDLLPSAEGSVHADLLLSVARDRLARGPLRPAEGADAAGMDPALREWMTQLGYLR